MYTIELTPAYSLFCTQLEIEKVQKRREERELERARADEEALMLNRERAVAEGFELDKKEELVRTLCPRP